MSLGILTLNIFSDLMLSDSSINLLMG